MIKPALELRPHHWDWTMTINAGTFLPLVQCAAGHMPRGGSVVAVSAVIVDGGYSVLA